jgi:hypothetical protein
MQVDRDTAEQAAPFDHAGVVMRVRDGDRVQSAEPRDSLNRCIVDQTHTIPENAAVLCLKQQSALADARTGAACGCPTVFAFLEELIVMLLPQVLDGYPFLSLNWNVLPLIFADRASSWRSVRRILRTTGDAELTQV